MPHGLIADKIMWYGVKISQSTNSGIGEGLDNAFTGYSFDSYHDPEYIVVINVNGNSANILNKPLSIVILHSA